MPRVVEAPPGPTVKAARIAGALYLLSGLTSFFALYVPPSLVVPGDATATATSILGSETLFRLGIVSDLISGISFILTAVALYRLLSGVNKIYASLMVIFNAVSVPILFLNAANELAALSLIHGGGFMSAYSQPQLDAMALVYLNLHAQGVVLTQVFWGLWLLPFGVLVYESGFIPRVLGVFLLAASFAIVANSFASLLALPYGGAFNLLSTALDALGELSAVAWLLVKGVTLSASASPAP